MSTARRRDMQAMREEDDGRPFNVDLFNARLKQARDLKRLAAGSKATDAAVAQLQEQFEHRGAGGSASLQKVVRVTVAPAHPAAVATAAAAEPSTAAGIDVTMHSSEAGSSYDDEAAVAKHPPPLAATQSMRLLQRAGSVIVPTAMIARSLSSNQQTDYSLLGQHYGELVRTGSLLSSSSSPAKRFRDDLADWRSKRKEVESALGVSALAEAKRGASRTQQSRGDNESTDPEVFRSGRLAAVNAARSLHQLSRLKLTALEEGLEFGDSDAPALASSEPSRALVPVSSQHLSAPDDCRISALHADDDDDDDTWKFEESRLRHRARVDIRAERDAIAAAIDESFSGPERPRDTHTMKLKMTLVQLEDEAQGVTRGGPVQQRTRYGHRRDGGAAAGKGGDGAEDAGVAGQRKGRARDELSRWGDVTDAPLHGYTETGAPCSEWETNIPEQDLHLYQLYCHFKKMIIVIRPVSASVPSLTAGIFFLHPKFCDSVGQPIPQPEVPLSQLLAHTTHDRRVRGKSINVSLKSSTYPPIDGLIPVNPGLGKAYLEAQRREREIEDMILNAKGGVVTITLLKKLKMQKAQAGSLTQAFRRDIEHALERSNRECAELLDRYKRELVLTVDKGAVSQQYIDRFNEAQYLGTTNALWRGFPIYYAELANGTVVRNERDVPYFYIKKGNQFYRHVADLNDIEKTPEGDPSNLKAVLVVTHRMFFVSPTTQRIEEDPESYLIGPDFDGLCYGSREEAAMTLEDRKEWAREMLDLQLVRSMGLVNKFDMAHVREVRELTEWKQNHGYECSNTVKTQPLTVGTYVVITPELVSIIKDVGQIIGFYRTAWRKKYPLILNPNWRVAIDSDHLPRPYGEDLVLPIIDDCGMAALMTRFDAGEGDGSTYDEMKKRFVPMADRIRAFEQEAERNPRKLGASSTLPKVGADEDLDVFSHLCRVLDRKSLAELFFAARRWQLLPPWRNAFTPGTEQEEGDSAEPPAAVAADNEEVNELVDFHVDHDFEAWRLDQVEEHLQQFDEAAKLYVRLHGKSQFVDTLYEYLNPEPDASSDGSSVTSLGSMRDFVF